MKKLTFVLVFLASFLFLTSLVSASPLEDFISWIYRTLGITPTGIYEPLGVGITSSEGNWVSPTGHEDPDNEWDNEFKAYDEATTSYARQYVGGHSWSSPLYLTLDNAINSNKVRFYASVAKFNGYDRVWLEVKRDGSWVEVYKGDFENNKWEEKTFSEGSVDQARIRLYNREGIPFIPAYLFEFDLWEVTATTTSTSTTTSTTTTISEPTYRISYEHCEDLTDVNPDLTCEETFTLSTSTTNAIELVENDVKNDIIWLRIDGTNSEIYYEDENKKVKAANIADNAYQQTVRFIDDGYINSYEFKWESCADLSDVNPDLTCEETFTLSTSTTNAIELVENDVKNDIIWLRIDGTNSEIYYEDENKKVKAANIADIGYQQTVRFISTPTTTTTTSTTTTIRDCNSECIARGYTSGVCKKGIRINGYTSCVGNEVNIGDGDLCPVDHDCCCRPSMTAEEGITLATKKDYYYLYSEEKVELTDPPENTGNSRTNEESFIQKMMSEPEIETLTKPAEETELLTNQIIVMNKKGNSVSIYNNPYEYENKPKKIIYYEERKQQTALIDRFGNYVWEGADSEAESSLTVKVTKSLDNYIVQFKEKSNLEYKQDLEEEVIKYEQEIKPRAWYDPVRWYGEITSVKREAVPKKLIEHKSKIRQIHTNFKKDLRGLNFKIKDEYRNAFNGVTLRLSNENVDKVRRLPYVRNVFRDEKVQTLLMDSVPLINANDVWALGYRGEGITVAVIDTGIDYTHPDLGGCFGSECKVIGGYDFVNDDSNPMDDQGHGTHCAGIVAANGALKGVAPDAKLLAYKVLDSGGSGYMSTVIAGIERAVDPNNDGSFEDHADVISMSLGGSGNPDDPISQAVDTAVENGVVVVIAAGNSGPYNETIGSPGTARKGITVGATDKNDFIAGFSSRGPVIWEGGAIIKPDVVAPGVDICSSQWDNAWQAYECFDTEHTAISGTSMATPHVAGAVALLLQAHPDWSPEQVKSALMLSSIDLNYGLITQGNGRIDVHAANDIAFTTTPQSIGINLGLSTTYSQEIIIENQKDYDIQLSLDAGTVREYITDKTYTIASIDPYITVPGNSESSVFLEINIPSGLDGIFYGVIKIVYDDEEYSIPYLFSKLSNLTITMDGNGRTVYPNFYLHDNNFRIYKSASQGSDFEGDTYKFIIPGGQDYSIYAVGDTKDLSFEYILMDSFYLPSSSDLTKTLRITDARPFTVKAKALDDRDLILYEWQKGFITYDDEYKHMSVNFYDPTQGDRIIYLSNKPANELNTDIIIKYFGVPV